MAGAAAKYCNKRGAHCGGAAQSEAMAGAAAKYCNKENLRVHGLSHLEAMAGAAAQYCNGELRAASFHPPDEKQWLVQQPNTATCASNVPKVSAVEEAMAGAAAQYCNLPEPVRSDRTLVEAMAGAAAQYCNPN